MINFKPFLVIYCNLKENKTHYKISNFLTVNTNPSPPPIAAYLPVCPSPPPPSPPGECVPPAFVAGGRTHSPGGEGGGGRSIFWKTPDTALYSTYVGTLRFQSIHTVT